MNAVIRPLNLPTEAELTSALRSHHGSDRELLKAVCGMLHASLFGTSPEWQRTRDHAAAMCAQRNKR